jgi:hypothetical protein
MQSKFLSNRWKSIKKCQAMALTFVLFTIELHPIVTQPWMEKSEMADEEMEDVSARSPSEDNDDSLLESITSLPDI